MTYRFETLAFKKAEILKVMQSIDPNFDLGFVQQINENDLTESIKYESKINFNDYRNLLFKMPLLSLWEAASIICGMNPALLDDLNEYDARAHYPDLSNALNFLNASNEAGLIEFDNFKIFKQEFQIFLSSQNIVIPGYNQIMENLNQDLNILDIQQEYDHLLSENDVLKDRLAQAEDRIKQLEVDQIIEQSNQKNLLDLIFDETAQDRYAPDLAYAIKAWESIYIKNPRTDSHNNKANTWIAKNTPYSGEQEETATRRLREVIAPLSEWRHTRKKT